MYEIRSVRVYLCKLPRERCALLVLETNLHWNFEEDHNRC